MMEAVRIRQQGYAVRQPHDDFFQKYRVLSTKTTTLKDLEEDTLLDNSPDAFVIPI
eukprot:gene5199-6886_t